MGGSLGACVHECVCLFMCVLVYVCVFVYVCVCVCNRERERESAHCWNVYKPELHKVDVLHEIKRYCN